MEGTLRILKRFIGSTIIISALLLVFNFLLLGVWVFNGMNKGDSPAEVVQSVAEGLQRSPYTFSLKSESEDILREGHAWAMLIDKSGKVAWDYMLPEEIPKTYSLTDIAKFTQSYLKDFPVFVWEHDEGLVVVGFPKQSFAKYQYILPTSWVASLPLRLVALLIINIGLALVLSLFIGYRLIRSIRPITKGIQALGEDREVFIEPKGILADLAENVNRVGALLHNKNSSLKERDEARSNWIAGISHDIRTPLSMILGYASDWEDNSNIHAEQRRQASIIRRQAENLRSLISDLNLVSMLEYEMQPLNQRPIRLSVLARQIVSELLNDGLEERFIIELQTVDERVQVNGDERLLKRAITNLIQNSINHNPDGCRILLQTTCIGDRTSNFIIEDNGVGIPKHEIPQLLELPFSSKRKRPTNNGHGLGLPMVARIVMAHKGQLNLSSDLGKGLRAEIKLPSIINRIDAG